VRPVALVLFPVMAFALKRHHRWRSVVAAVGVALLIIGGWAVRNQRLNGIFTFSDESVLNLYSGSRPPPFWRPAE
jgi:hypothetical protein